MQKIDVQYRDHIVKEVQKSSKYHTIIPDLIARIVSLEIKKRQSRKDIIKAAKRKLHQIGGAYISRDIPYSFYRDEFKKLQDVDTAEDFPALCKKIMRLQSSTNERISILETFYTTILDDIRPIKSIADIACGLNPLAIPWMSLDEGTVYYAYDIYADMVSFLNEFMEITPVYGHAIQCDITESLPQKQVDLVFMLKCLPCLEQIEKDFFSHYFKGFNGKYMIISFPVRSLGGKNKKMRENYENKFMSYMKDLNVKIDKFEFSTELAFRITF